MRWFEYLRDKSTLLAKQENLFSCRCAAKLDKCSSKYVWVQNPNDLMNFERTEYDDWTSLLVTMWILAKSVLTRRLLSQFWNIQFHCGTAVRCKAADILNPLWVHSNNETILNHSQTTFVAWIPFYYAPIHKRIITWAFLFTVKRAPIFFGRIRFLF